MRDIPPWILLAGPFLVVAFPPLIIPLALVAWWEWSDGGARIPAIRTANRWQHMTLEQTRAQAAADSGPLHGEEG